MINSQKLDNLKCPFCLNHSPEAKPGNITCPECSAEFEVDDRMECVFADTKNMKLPVNGMVCGVCGLVQGGVRWRCGYCGAKISTTSQ